MASPDNDHNDHMALYGQLEIIGFWKDATWMLKTPDGGVTVYRQLFECPDELKIDGEAPTQLYISNSERVGFDWEYGYKTLADQAS